MKERNFSYHVERSKMQTFEFADCRCGNTVIKARMRESQQTRYFNPEPVGGSEMDRVYSQHACQAQEKDEDEPRWGNRF